MSKCSPTRPPPSSGLESRAVDHALSRLLAHDRIRAARHHIERTDEGTLARQAALSAIPAPTGAEGRRAAHVAELFRTIGLCDVMVDHAGNVHGWLGKNGEKSAPVGEEGSGDLRGVKYLLNGKHSVGAQHAAPPSNATALPSIPAAFIALDGAGLDRVIHRALGSKRYHVTFRGPGERDVIALGA